MTLAADKILVAVGRKPATEGWGLEAIDLDMDGPFIRIDDQCRTSMRGVYAIGDVTGEPMLAHRASAQGEMVAEIVAGEKRCLGQGLHSGDLLHRPRDRRRRAVARRGQGCRYRDQDRPISLPANGRAMTLENEAGFIRVVARADNHLLLGIQGVGAGIAELSAAFGLALEMGARLEDIAADDSCPPDAGRGAYGVRAQGARLSDPPLTANPVDCLGVLNSYAPRRWPVPDPGPESTSLAAARAQLTRTGQGEALAQQRVGVHCHVGDEYLPKHAIQIPHHT